MPALSHSRHCLLRDTTDIVCNVAQQTYLLCETTEMSVVSPPPQHPDAKRWLCVAVWGGQAPLILRHKAMVQHIQDLHYANLWFFVAGGGGAILRHKTTVLCRKQKS